MPCVTTELQANEMQSELWDITSQLAQHISARGALRFLSLSDDSSILIQQAKQPSNLSYLV